MFPEDIIKPFDPAIFARQLQQCWDAMAKERESQDVVRTGSEDSNLTD